MRVFLPRFVPGALKNFSFPRSFSSLPLAQVREGRAGVNPALGDVLSTGDPWGHNSAADGSSLCCCLSVLWSSAPHCQEMQSISAEILLSHNSIMENSRLLGVERKQRFKLKKNCIQIERFMVFTFLFNRAKRKPLEFTFL